MRIPGFLSLDEAILAQQVAIDMKETWWLERHQQHEELQKLLPGFVHPQCPLCTVETC